MASGALRSPTSVGHAAKARAAASCGNGARGSRREAWRLCAPHRNPRRFRRRRPARRTSDFPVSGAPCLPCCRRCSARRRPNLRPRRRRAEVRLSRASRASWEVAVRDSSCVPPGRLATARCNDCQSSRSPRGIDRQPREVWEAGRTDLASSGFCAFNLFWVLMVAPRSEAPSGWTKRYDVAYASGLENLYRVVRWSPHPARNTWQTDGGRTLLFVELR
mmetsp:Transcript_74758/g.216040  ORF Transcript_74758/g.216040 Transcript_74758/m.216040 type:complete len:219 (+) Transcript_74758:312-968(+)